MVGAFPSLVAICGFGTGGGTPPELAGEDDCATGLGA